MIGSTTSKKVWIGVQPSIMAASSISRGMDFTKPVNMNTDNPAPNPRYTIISPQGVFSLSMFTIFDKGNMTIWKGTIMENRHR